MANPLRLCEECDRLIDHQDKIKVLSMTHANLQKVLAEIEDIVVLPSRADMVLGLMDDPANLLPVFEALTVLEGTAESAKQAWNRCQRQYAFSSYIRVCIFTLTPHNLSFTLTLRCSDWLQECKG